MLLTESRLTFRGVKPLQRLGTAARALAFDNPLAGMVLAPNLPNGLRSVPPDPWPGDAQQGRDMVSGIFTFAGQTISKDDLAWEPETAIPEWLNELHSFEWLRNLRSVSGDRARRMAREMVSSWFTQYPKYHDLAWRADITGRRLRSWISFHDFFCASADDAFRKNYFTSLIKQTKYLSKVLPVDLSGIPLLHGYRGLAYAGIALEEGDKWLAQGLNGMVAQIREQILPDGGHISRSPQATFEFLSCLVDIRAALISAKMEMPEELQDAIDRIATAVKFFRHGDGTFAHFNGGQEGNAALCETTLMHSGARGKALLSLQHSGYERIAQGRSSVIMDVGLPVMSAYSDRAHAGLLSFEYSYGRERVIVNCGTSAVEGRWRRVLRSTLAHSTLIADNRNSCPFDATGLLSGRPTVRASRQEDSNTALIVANHNGYMPRFGLVHNRIVRLQEEGDILFGEDQLSGKAGVPFAIRFHLHPNIQAEVVAGGTEVHLRSKSGVNWRFRTIGAQIALEESIYGGTGETPVPSSQIILTGQTFGAVTTVAWEMKREQFKLQE